MQLVVRRRAIAVSWRWAQWPPEPPTAKLKTTTTMMMLTVMPPTDTPSDAWPSWRASFGLFTASALATTTHAPNIHRYWRSLPQTFHRRGGHIVSWFDLQMCSKVIEDTAIVLNTYDFLLVLNAGCISSFLRYSRFYAEMTLLGNCDL